MGDDTRPAIPYPLEILTDRLALRSPELDRAPAPFRCVADRPTGCAARRMRSGARRPR